MPTHFKPHPTEAQALQGAAPDLRTREIWERVSDRLPPYTSASEAVREWFQRLMMVVLPGCGGPEEIAAKAAFVFGFDAGAAHTRAENRAVLAADSARIVLAELVERALVHEGPVRLKDFEGWLNEIGAATGYEGRALLDPVRIALTGTCGRAELGSLILLLEDPVARDLGVPSVCDRIERFVGL